MSEISFRPCHPQDVDRAVPLIYSSGPAAFDYVFCDCSEQQSLEFLRQAFVAGNSEFGYRQHTAALLDGTLVGVCAIRDATQNLAFTLSALRSIASFYPPLAAMRTITRGLRTELVIQPPKSGVGVIYHLGVAPEFRGLGIGRKLLQKLLEQIHERGLETAALDVAETNPRAKSLYKCMGFSEKHTRTTGLHSRFGRVPDHTHMELPLNSGKQPV
ncbi:MULTISPECIES: GNAT family N-acetyltransferase [unclassified Microbulbifer]|uniref:GNAT family N-acetyltransferase n=1 Tax=unclassified Microbulbifer TaxID=2619833 RepID=UPI0027E58954|nr:MULTISPECIES: GNAT family N-acetyltransferase [unclassified Microbulbifer]